MDENAQHQKALAAIGSKPMMLMVHMVGCGHCERMKSDWSALESELQPDIVVASVRTGSDAYEKLPANIKSMAEKGYPLVVAVTPEGKAIEYKQEGDGKYRSTSDMKAFAIKTLGKPNKQKGGKARRKRSRSRKTRSRKTRSRKTRRRKTRSRKTRRQTRWTGRRRRTKTRR